VDYLFSGTALPARTGQEKAAHGRKAVTAEKTPAVYPSPIRLVAGMQLSVWRRSARRPGMGADSYGASGGAECGPLLLDGNVKAGNGVGRKDILRSGG